MESLSAPGRRYALSTAILWDWGQEGGGTGERPRGGSQREGLGERGG